MKKQFLKKIAKEMVKRGEATDWKVAYKELLPRKEEIFNEMAEQLRRDRRAAARKGSS